MLLQKMAEKRKNEGKVNVKTKVSGATLPFCGKKVLCLQKPGSLLSAMILTSSLFSRQICAGCQMQSGEIVDVNG